MFTNVLSLKQQERTINERGPTNKKRKTYAKQMPKNQITKQLQTTI